jgi:hypothetical protein
MPDQPVRQQLETLSRLKELRLIFVQLLFSLTAAEIARQTADLVLRNRNVSDDLPAYVHLVLATVVVATSWVGWSTSTASLRGRLRVDKIFTGAFVVLLLDVSLVILYYILARGVETPVLHNPIPEVVAGAAGLVWSPLGIGPLVAATTVVVEGAESTLVIRPSAAVESWTIMAIFIGYLVWDFFTKAVVPPEPGDEQFTFWTRLMGKTFWERGKASVTCAVIAILVGLCLFRITSYWGVIIADLSLLMLVLLFRALKDQWWGMRSSWLALGCFVATIAATCLSAWRI